MKKFIAILGCLSFLLSTFSQSKKDTVNADSVIAKKGKVLLGIASFYSKSLEGTRTATNELFNHVRLTGASNSFKLNSWVRVTNLRNGQTVIVRINDRMSKGMARRGRIIDLTRAAAEKLDFLHRGIIKVKVEQVFRGTIK